MRYFCHCAFIRIYCSCQFWDEPRTPPYFYIVFQFYKSFAFVSNVFIRKTHIKNHVSHFSLWRLIITDYVYIYKYKGGKISFRSFRRHMKWFCKSSINGSFCFVISVGHDEMSFIFSCCRDVFMLSAAAFFCITSDKKTVWHIRSKWSKKIHFIISWNWYKTFLSPPFRRRRYSSLFFSPSQHTAAPSARLLNELDLYRFRGNREHVFWRFRFIFEKKNDFIRQYGVVLLHFRVVENGCHTTKYVGP